MNKLALALAFDESRFLQNSKMMGNRGGGNTAHGNDLSAVHVVAAANGLENEKARFIRQRFGDPFDFLAIHC